MAGRECNRAWGNICDVPDALEKDKKCENAIGGDELKKGNRRCAKASDDVQDGLCDSQKE
jgi:hypothetical protein